MTRPDDNPRVPARRVLVLCEYPTLGGGEHSLLSTVPFIQRAGYEVNIAAPPDGPLADTVIQRGLRLIPFESCDADGRRRSQSALRDRLTRVLRDAKPQLLHANSLSMARLSGPVAAGLKLPSIGHLRDILKLSAAAVADLNRHRRLIAVSAATRDAHVRQGLDAAKTCVIHNGVDLELFRPRQPTGWLHRELGLPADAMLVGSIGQMVLRKGQDVLAVAAGLLADDLPQLHYVIVGRRYSQKAEALEYEAALLDAFSRGALAGHAHFLDVRDDVPRILPELTMLVHTARQEPLGRVLLEAAAAGVPIIATDVGGTREVFPVYGEPSALIVPPDDPIALAAAMRSLVDHPHRRREISAAARRRAENAFAAQMAASKSIQQYEQVLAER